MLDCFDSWTGFSKSVWHSLTHIRRYGRGFKSGQRVREKCNLVMTRERYPWWLKAGREEGSFSFLLFFWNTLMLTTRIHLWWRDTSSHCFISKGWQAKAVGIHWCTVWIDFFFFFHPNWVIVGCRYNYLDASWNWSDFPQASQTDLRDGSPHKTGLMWKRV